jgi:hypothetical protein
VCDEIKPAWDADSKMTLGKQVLGCSWQELQQCVVHCAPDVEGSDFVKVVGVLLWSARKQELQLKVEWHTFGISPLNVI